MTVAGKYPVEQAIGWSDGATIYQGPPDPARRQPTALKVRRGTDGQDADQARFVQAARDQQAASEGGCRWVAPIFEAGRDGDDAYYVTRRFPRSAESLIKGRTVLEADGLERIAGGALKALEELRDRQTRSHGNLKPANLFLEGKNAGSFAVFLGDLAPRDAAGSQAADCYALGAVICQLVRGRAVRHFDWPIVSTAEWERLGSDSGKWREFCNVLMSPETATRPDALAVARDAYKHMGRLGAKAEARARDIAEASGETYRPSARSKKGLWVGLGASLAAVTGSAALLTQPADSRLGQTLRGVPFLASLYKLVDVPKIFPTPTPAAAVDPTPRAAPSATPARIAEASPAAEPSSTPEATPTLAAETPAPTPDAPAPTPDPKEQQRAEYIGRLEQMRRILDEPTTRSQPEALNGALGSLRSIDTYRPLAFVQALPDHLDPATEDPELPATIWQKQPAGASANTPGSSTFTHKATGASMTFNKVTATDGQAFYVGATAVPVLLGRGLAKAAGYAPASQPLGPVAWIFNAGEFYLNSAWIADNDSVKYSDKGEKPSALSPMNGLSGTQADKLAKAAGCTLPTLSQWKTLLSSPAGTYWKTNWQTVAKLRGPAWSAFAKQLKSDERAGKITLGAARLPNDQCFGDIRNLEPVGADSPTGFFFEQVSLRLHEGYCHLVGNVGQYVTADGGGAQYYFAGGSAESPPTVFANGLDVPPSVPGAITYADGGLRLVARPARKVGSDQAFVKLSDSLNAELARARGGL